MRSQIFEVRAWWFDVPPNVPIRRRSFVVGCVVNGTDNNSTAARVFTKPIPAELAGLGRKTWVLQFQMDIDCREGKRSKEIADVNLFPFVHVFENAECRLPLEFVYAQANVGF